jgi:hypothetical protein
VDSTLRHTEDILDIATAGDPQNQNFLLIVDRRGGIRMLDAGGWSMGGLRAELGAEEIYHVERRDGEIRVEGQAGPDHCIVQRNLRSCGLRDLPGFLPVCHPIMLQVPALPAA